MTFLDRTGHMTPNEIQGAVQELERLRRRLESELEDALELVRSRDYCGAAAALENTEKMAAHLAKREEQIDEQRQRLKLAHAPGPREADWRARVLGV